MIRIGLFIAACFLVAWAVLVWPFGAVDLKDVPAGLPLQPPYARVDVGYYLDGGSVGLQVVEQSGQTNLLALPVGVSGGKRVYTNLVIGTIWVGRTNTPGMPLTDELRDYLAALIEHHGTPKGDAALALSDFRGAPKDYLRMFNHVFRTKVLGEGEAELPVAGPGGGGGG